MKKHAQLLFCILFSFSASAQEKTDTIAKKENKISTGIFISAGVNVIQYNTQYTSGFLYDLNDKTNTAESNYLYGLLHSPNLKNTTYSKAYNTKSAISPALNIGMVLNAAKFKKINHVIEMGYMRFSGNYSFSSTYSFTDHPPSLSYKIYDTSQIKYMQTILCFGYKLQPAYKYMFFSLGINGGVNFIKAEIQKQEQPNNSTWPAPYFYPDLINKKIYFVTAALQMGAGIHFKVKEMVFKPAFYFAPFLMRGYNFYNVSLDILFGRKKNRQCF